LIDRGARRLHDEHVGAADVLVDLKRDFRVREPPQPRLSDRASEKCGNLPGQLRMGAAREDFQVTEPRCHERITHHVPPPRPAGSSRVALWADGGWGGRIRTFEYGIQSPAPYRLATPHRS